MFTLGFANAFRNFQFFEIPIPKAPLMLHAYITKLIAPPQPSTMTRVALNFLDKAAKFSLLFAPG